jgi:hypothetical protein
MSAKSGAAGLPVGSFNAIAWHSEHYCSASARLLRASACAGQEAENATNATLATREQMVHRLIINLLAQSGFGHCRLPMLWCTVYAYYKIG